MLAFNALKPLLAYEENEAREASMPMIIGASMNSCPVRPPAMAIFTFILASLSVNSCSDRRMSQMIKGHF